MKILDKVLPFFFCVDKQGQILQMGPSMKKLILEDQGPWQFKNHFEIISPKAKNFVDLFESSHHSMVVLRILNCNVDIRGQIIPLDEPNMYLFAMNLIVQNANELTKLNLTFNDFAVQDSIFDFLMLLQTQQRTLLQTEHLNIKLKQLNKIAMEASQTKSQFLANMSHELRTPMNGFLAMASILLETNLDAEQKDYVETLIKSGESMLTLVNDILDFSKIEAGFIQLNPEVMNVQDWLTEIYNSVYTLATKKKIELQFRVAADVPQYIEADSNRLRQIIINLVGNAVKFTKKGTVSVNIKLANVQDNLSELQFVIKDTGIGMDANTLSRIFSPFIQGDSSMTKQFEGTGLGLSICKKLVEAMGGKMGVSSIEGEGSEFIIYIAFPEVQKSLVTTVQEDFVLLSA